MEKRTCRICGLPVELGSDCRTEFAGRYSYHVTAYCHASCAGLPSDAEELAERVRKGDENLARHLEQCEAASHLYDYYPGCESPVELLRLAAGMRPARP